ncbi:hypothetical protein AJ78_04079 [Emergomyces pasteurianus Ep9510]|uniref:Actin cytoskeleton-regulatory complex protein END3 n=1 Tax=Emergomyces pasteurianus Ep9510 TaxID=1447872 RepID=A0A1J9QKE5_9EURO|nr:hypothetical protein AJ78_04079 [Emergomyces pasteurianus Ep9510]
MADGGHPNLNLTPEEKRVFYKLFQAADKTNLGVVTGEVAVSFFEKTSLPPETLGLIWQIADTQNRGLLTPSGFGVVMRLIGHAQAGRPPTEELALQPGPLPKFSGLSKDIMEPTPLPPPVASSPPPGAGPVRVPPLAPEDVTKFTSLFERSEVHNGLLSGENAKQIFERARLPNEVLGRIWNLADTKQRGALDATEFIIAMHLLSAYRNGTMRILPQALPPGLYDAAARRGGVRTSTGSRSSSDIPPVPAIPKQFSGSGPQRTQSPLNRPPQFQSTVSVQSTGGDWTITPQEKAHFDTVFATVDKANLGYITGDQAVEFFTNAQLPEETLASIWDLADIDSDGQLSKDEFAVAMYLVRQQRTTREPLPQALPSALIPPSMRRQMVSAPAAAPAPAPQIVPQNTAQRSAAEDLFGLDVFGAPAQAAQTTGGSNTAVQPQPSSPTRSPLSASATSTFKPFIPSSTFGQSLTPHTTGMSNAPVQQRSPPPSADDLLADVDLEASRKVSQESVDLANLSNQIGSLSREMQHVQGKRAAAEQDLTQNSQQKKDFEARLAQARIMYEQEAKDFKALEDRLAASRTETKKLQQDFALIEASRQDLQNQYNQVNAALDADQRENVSLKEQIRQANAQVSQLKPLLEKARSAARQQKGLVAINKKQLATVEGERDRMQGEIDNTTREVDGLQRQTSEISSPVTQPPPVTSPAPSTASQTNPFFRRTTSLSENSFSPPPSSQEPSKDPQSVFDNVFGPSFTVPATSTPPPPTSFRTESPAQQAFTAAGLEKVSNTSDSLTPSPSPTPAEPPPPPQSRQISSSQLPIEGHQSSEASSVRPSPPASRFGASVASDREVSSPTKLPFDSEQPKPDATKDKPPGLSERSTSQTRQEPEASDIPGSFPAEPAQAESAKKEASFDELFGGITHARSPSQKANDFEEAFAAMKVKNGRGDSGFPEVPSGKSREGPSEFPPIRELDDDEESTDSEAAKGFDDDFSPVSPPRHNEPVSRDVISPQPFSPSAQATSFPGMNGQGPSKEGPPATALAANGLPTVGKDNTGNSQPALPGKKPAVQDFEAAFAGLDLAPAQEADDDEDEDEDDDDFESPFNKDSSNFDMTFDSPGAPSKPSTIADATAGTSSGNNTTNTDFVIDSNQKPSTSPFPPKPGSTNPSAPAPGNDSQDWDALFSVLDSSKTPNETTGKPTTSEGAHPPDSTTLSSFPQPPGKEAKPPGWALSADTGEDDLILQRLTGMGYPRDESLAALEKFDYNLDKVG